MARHANIVHLTNCRVARGHQLEHRDLWISRSTGRIENAQEAFFSDRTVSVETVDLGGRIVAPGFIDVQINGSFGFDFSTPGSKYAEQLAVMNRQLAKTGVTSYLPTLPSQGQEIYEQTLHYLAQPTSRNGRDGAESLGAHCEGPFINVDKHGIHRPAVIQQPKSGLSSLQACYGTKNIDRPSNGQNPAIKCITLAPEEAGSDREAAQMIKSLCSRGIVVSIGHSAATEAQMQNAVHSGATMITHLFNAMSSPHHRETGIFGSLGRAEEIERPFFGIIADNIHVAPNMVRVAYNAHPDGCILVTDAMAMVGMPDGEYNDFPWTNGATVLKRGIHLTLKGIEGSIAGSAVTLLECVNNLLRWTGLPVASALRTVTCTPAKMLSLQGVKGTLDVGADADLVVFDEVRSSKCSQLEIFQVWKFGELIHEASPSMIQARL